jgi:AraC family transcriptional regulator of adaptative response/methylated-DNA-[protein]-cysteine methyltransferase
MSRAADRDPAAAGDGAIDVDAAWRAVLSRDETAAGRFVYAVLTTGVFCRPGCPSRPPRRRNVRFYESPAAALAAGFRPCKRCGEARADAAQATVTAACEFLEQHLDERVTLSRLGGAVGMSPAHLQRVFTRRTGVTPREYSEALRVQRLKRELRAGTGVERALCEAGFGSPRAGHERGARALGMTPGEYAAGRVAIEFATGDCDYGRLLVAATRRGICAVCLGEEDASLEAALRNEFPAAPIARGGERLYGLLEVVTRIAAGGRAAGDLPLDVQASAFQWRVWRALQQIEPGEVRTYAGLARELGIDGGARAVGGACASNPVALVVPCHRVVRADGSPGGYRWGSERKAAMLAAERAAAGALSCR